jgi:Dyp-type peroxidase family
VLIDSPRGLELDDIQRGVLHPRPSPYVGSYLLLRIADRRVGRALLQRLIPVIASAAEPMNPNGDTWVSVSLTFQGLRALGVPEDSLASFPLEFQQGMAARAAILGDVDESSPVHWETPLGTRDVHVAVVVLSPDEARRDALLERVEKAYPTVEGVKVIYRQDARVLPTGREPFGFKDGISQPAVEGSPIAGTNHMERPLKAGEFVLGYPDETGAMAATPQPDVLGRNGTYVVVRKLHQRVAAFRHYLRTNAASAEEQTLLSAKMMGRWPSGAPLVLSPDRDEPALGAEAARNNEFLYHVDDPKGLRCPAGAHVRRANPRDAFQDELIGVNRLHRMIRRSTTYGPPLPEGVLEDDGADRGLVFVAIGAHLKRQFEFVQTQWVNDGVFRGAPGEKDPIVGPNDGTGGFTIPRQPVRRRIVGLPQFVINRGGEYCFTPGMRALRWLAELDT